MFHCIGKYSIVYEIHPIFPIHVMHEKTKENDHSNSLNIFNGGYFGLLMKWNSYCKTMHHILGSLLLSFYIYWVLLPINLPSIQFSMSLSPIEHNIPHNRHSRDPCKSPPTHSLIISIKDHFIPIKGQISHYAQPINSLVSPNNSDVND